MSVLIKTISCNDAFIKLSQMLSGSPEYRVAPRGDATYELTNVIVEIINPYDRLVNHIDRKLCLRYLVGEFLWYERASNLLSEISDYSSFWNKISDDGLTANSAYGTRIYKKSKNGGLSQWSKVVNELVKDKTSRRAMLVIAKPDDFKMTTKDAPCTIGVQFLIRDNKLNMTVWMRSNDLYLGFCYDAAIFTLWQEKLLLALNDTYPELTLGSYTHHATSLHVYEKYYHIINRVASNPDNNNENPLFEIPRIKNLEAIEKIQTYEKKLRLGIDVSNFIIEDDFANWLIRCLNYEC